MQDDSGMRKETSKNKAITARQKQYLEAYKATGSASKAADILGVSTDSVVEALRRVKALYGKTSIKDLKETGKRSVNSSDLMKLIKKQEYRCALSGEKLTPKTAELDHKVALSCGGSDEIDNLQWLDREINRMKGRMSCEEFIAACKRVSKWTS